MSNGHREWVRLDCTIGSHDKTLALLAHRKGRDAFCTYVFSLAWSGAHGTEGHLPRSVLPVLHGSRPVAALLVDVGLWEPAPTGDGWIIRNWHLRQETNEQLERNKHRARVAACRRWHEPGCGCTDLPP